MHTIYSLLKNSNISWNEFTSWENNQTKLTNSKIRKKQGNKKPNSSHSRQCQNLGIQKQFFHFIKNLFRSLSYAYFFSRWITNFIDLDCRMFLQFWKQNNYFQNRKSHLIPAFFFCNVNSVKSFYAHSSILFLFLFSHFSNFLQFSCNKEEWEVFIWFYLQMWFTDFYVTQGNNHTSKIEYIYKDLNDFIYTDFRKSKKINRNFRFVS